MTLYDPKAIQAQIGERLSDLDALTALCQEEDREPTAEENAQFQALMDEVGLDADGDTPASGLRAKLATANRFQRIRDQSRPGNDGSTTGVIGRNDGGFHQSDSEPFAIPRACLERSRNLKAFKPREGENHLHDAYAAGRWLYALLGHEASADWCDDYGMGRIQAAQQEGDNSLGGFFVPVEMATRIIDLRYQYGVARRFADVEPMASETKTVPRRKSGVTAYAVGEAEAVTESDMDFTQVMLVARAWAALVKMSRELDEDAVINFADRVAGEMAWAFAKKEDESLFIGDGTSTYHGVVGIVPKANDGSHAGAIYDAASGNTAYSTLDIGDFEGMIGQLPSWAEDGAAWYLHKVGYWASIGRLMNAAGGNTMTDYGNGPELSFMGYPVRFTPVMNSTTDAQTSTAGLAILGNLPLSSTIGDRRGFSFQVLNELYAANRQIGLIGDTRFAMNNHSITEPEDTTGATAGAVVVMKTPAS